MVDIIKVYDSKFKICGEVRSIVDGKKNPSIVEPGAALPMNKLVKGVINGSIVINPSNFVFDFSDHEIDVDDNGLTPQNVAQKTHDAFVDELQKQSSTFTDPTAAPGFNVNDAEQIQAQLEETLAQGAIEGARGSSGAGAAPQKAGDGSNEDPSGSLSSDGANGSDN